MSNYPLSMNEEPDLELPVEFNDLEASDMEQQPVLWQDIPRDLQAELEKLERNEANENTIERTLRDEQIWDEQTWAATAIAPEDRPTEEVTLVLSKDTLIER